jgi:hypothetical protein
MDTAVIRIRFDNVSIEKDVLDRLERRGRLGGQLLRAYNAAHPIPDAMSAQPIEIHMHELHMNMPLNKHASPLVPRHFQPPLPPQPLDEQMTTRRAHVHEPPDTYDGTTTVVCDDEVANAFGVSFTGG